MKKRRLDRVRPRDELHRVANQDVYRLPIDGLWQKSSDRCVDRFAYISRGQ